jgi:DNA repair protein RecO (recombination protein O)
MSRHETLWALVLRHEDRGEADRTYVLLTPSGRLFALARGVRRPKSRLAGALEGFNLCRVTLYRQGRVPTVTGAVAEHVFRRLKESLDALAAAGVLAELVERLDPEGSLFPWLIGRLEALDGGAPALPLLLEGERELLQALGWSPGGASCPICGQPIEGRARLVAGETVLVHPACATGGLLVSDGARRFLAGEGPPTPPGETWEVLRRIFEAHLEAEVRSEPFARTVLLR